MTHQEHPHPDAEGAVGAGGSEGSEGLDLYPRLNGSGEGRGVPAEAVEPEDLEPEDVEPAGVEPSEGEEPQLIGTSPYDYRTDLRYTPRRRRRRLLAALLVVLVALVVVGVVGFVHVSDEINPPGKPGHMVSVIVPAKASAHEVADLLAKKGVIHGPTVFEIYLKLKGAGAMLPGTYQMATNEAYSTALYILEKGPVAATYKLVVPEGFTVRQIAAAVGHLRGAGISERAFLEAAERVRSPYEPKGADNLEGLLFPATYPLQKGDTADELVKYMVSTFDSHAAELGLSAAAERLGYSPYQVVIVASVVEREAKFEADRGPIASVIYNRLARGMPIGAESTLLYGLAEPKGPFSLSTPNRYNTLLNKGLPPTPISSPGVPSLEAAMRPPKTTYLYWVEVNPDGKMGYASNEAQFKHLQAECRAVRLGC